MIVTVRPAIRPIALLLPLVLAVACDDGLSPEERVATLAAVDGNEQGGVAGTQLPQPLVVRALDGDGRVIRGVTVTWEVATGNGTIEPTTTETNDDGRASANWTLGPTAGEQTVIARVDTIRVTFRATAIAGAAATITLTPSPLLLDAIGATGQLNVDARDTNGNPITGRSLQWQSTAPSVAQVANGVVTAVSPGTATITARLDDATGQAEVRVEPVVATIVVTPATPTLTALGQTLQFSASARDRLGTPINVPAQDFAWSSSNSQVLEVSTTGLASAKANGTAQAIATLGQVAGQTLVTVRQVPVSLNIAPDADTLTTAQPFVQLFVTGTDANNQPIASPTVTWSSANNAIATVTTFGVVNAVSNGDVYIRATAGNVSDSALISVRLNAPPKALADVIPAQQNTLKVLAAPGLLANDTTGVPPAPIVSFGDGSLGGLVTAYPAGSTATFGTGGSLKVNADGSLEFMPSTGFTGDFTFVYRIANAAGSSDAIVRMQVGVAPAAVDDSYSTGPGTTLDVPAASGVVANDTQGFPVGAVVSFGGGSLAGDAGTFPAGQLVAFGVGGFLRLNADGSLSFTPPVGFTGAFTVRYRLSNGAGSSDATITINVM